MKKAFLLFTVAVLFFMSCSPTDNDKGDSNLLLIKNMDIDYEGSDDDDLNVSFFYKGNKLASIKKGKLLLEEYIYTGDKLTRLNRPADNSYIVIAYGQDNKVSSFTEYIPDFDEARKNIVAFEGSNYTVTTYSGTLASPTQLGPTVVYTVQGGNIVRSDSDFLSGNTFTDTFEYDTKNNPFKNISNFDVIQIVNNFWGISQNNVMAENSNEFESHTSTYVYNSNNYPTIRKFFSIDGALGTTITYSYY